MNKVSRLNKGDFIIPEYDTPTLANFVSLIAGNKYKVLHWSPKLKIPEFKSKVESYLFYCGQIIPEQYHRGTITVVYKGFKVDVSDTDFVHYEY